MFKKFFKKKSKVPQIPPTPVVAAPRVSVKQEAETIEAPTEQTMCFDEVATSDGDINCTKAEGTQDADSSLGVETTIIEEGFVQMNLLLKSPEESIDIALNNEDKLTVTLGRNKKESDIVVKDPRVSRTHCRFVLDADKKEIILEDLESSNGTKINGEKIDLIHVLNVGDLLTIGRTEYKVRFLG